MIDIWCLDVEELPDSFLDNFSREYENFSKWSGSGSPDRHHYGDGGLLEHTNEVLQSGLKMCEFYGISDKDKQLFAVAAIFHDVGKLWDYEENLYWWTMNEEDGEGRTLRDNKNPYIVSDHKKTIHHLSRSVIEFTKFNEKYNYFDDSDFYAIAHCMLAHHGQRAWGSPVEPVSKIAWILHCCDLLSARQNEAPY